MYSEFFAGREIYCQSVTKVLTIQAWQCLYNLVQVAGPWIYSSKYKQHQ